VGMPLAFLIDAQVNALVACLSFFLLLPTTVTLCLLFVPKIIKLKNNVEELLRLQSLSAIRGSAANTAGTSNSLESQTVNDPNVVLRLEEETAALKQELRAIKSKYNEKATPNLSVRIIDPVDNGREGRLFSQSESSPLPRPSPRPQLGKRSATCHTAQELGVRKGRKRRRSSSFSGPYLQRRSLDLGSLYSELADPLLVLKAENKELHRKLQEARISETGKLAKVLYENAQLNRKIVELNIKNATSDEAEKVSRLVKENAELKKQLGEVSILNSVWCDVTPRLQRKQKEEGKISKDLRELQHLLNIDLGGRRHCSFGPSSLSRPPPIGRSQSSSDLQTSSNVSSPTDKKTTISPLAKGEVKRFNFDGVSKNQKIYAKDSKTGIELMVTDAEKDNANMPESPQNETSESVPSCPVRRDNIDGCESEKETWNNEVFLDEDEVVGNPMTNTENCNVSNKQTGKDDQMGDSKVDIPIVRTLSDGKGHLDRTIDIPGCNLALATVTVHEPLRTTNEPTVEGPSADVLNGNFSCELGATFVPQLTDLPINGPNETPGIHKLTRQGHYLSANPAETVSSPKPRFFPDSTNETISSSLIITNFDAVLDQNSNLRSSEKVKTTLDVNNSKVNCFSEETAETASQDQEKVESSERTLVLGKNDVAVKDKEHLSNEGSPRDLPAYKKRLRKRKDKTKNDKIEKTFFV